MRFDLKGYLQNELETILTENQLGFDNKANGKLESLITLVYKLNYSPSFHVVMNDGPARQQLRSHKNLERYIRNQHQELIAERLEHKQNIISLGTQLGKLKQELDTLKAKEANPS